MIEIITYQDSNGRKPYAEWLDRFNDKKTKARILVRVNRMSAGNFGDCKALREGVQELKIDIGPGYRVYLSKQGAQMVLLLCGGDKDDQSRDIERAIAYLNDWKKRGKP